MSTALASDRSSSTRDDRYCSRSISRWFKSVSASCSALRVSMRCCLAASLSTCDPFPSPPPAAASESPLCPAEEELAGDAAGAVILNFASCSVRAAFSAATSKSEDSSFSICCKSIVESPTTDEEGEEEEEEVPGAEASYNRANS